MERERWATQAWSPVLREHRLLAGSVLHTGMGEDKLRRPARGGPEMGRGKLMETPIKSKGRGRLFQVREE